MWLGVIYCGCGRCWMTRKVPLWLEREQKGDDYDSDEDEDDLYRKMGFWAYQVQTLPHWASYCSCWCGKTLKKHDTANARL